MGFAVEPLIAAFEEPRPRCARSWSNLEQVGTAGDLEPE